MAPLELSWDEGEMWLRRENPAWKEVSAALFNLDGSYTTVVGLVVHDAPGLDAPGLDASGLDEGVTVLLVTGRDSEGQVVLEAIRNGETLCAVNPNTGDGLAVFNLAGEPRQLQRRCLVPFMQGIRAFKTFMDDRTLDATITWEAVENDQ